MKGIILGPPRGKALFPETKFLGLAELAETEIRQFVTDKMLQDKIVTEKQMLRE